MPDDFDVLAGSVKHLHHPLVSHQVEEWLQIDPRRQRIHHHGFVRARKLGDAKLRIIGRLAQEFGIDGDEGMLRETFAGIG